MPKKAAIEGGSSFFDHRSLDELYEEIRTTYLADSRPWVLGYSGGKDSTCALQLVWSALAELPPERRSKPVFVISSDTLVETPVISRYIETSLDRINTAGVNSGLPFQAHKVMPRIDHSFWVNLIGRGYPAPTNKFRWCTERLKINPANEFILGRVAEFGEVVLVLGVRSSESATRAQVMSLHRVLGTHLARHTSLPNAFVYPVIEAFSVDDVWTYLLQVRCPWGNDNRDLVAMYRSAQAGECPLVVDSTTPSCGNSRFGCWVCTVVSQDRSMQAMVDSGEDWLAPLLDFREQLAETQDPDKKRQYRDFRRKSGRVSFIGSSAKPVPGPYKLEFCKQLLRQLLTAQLQVQSAAPEDVTVTLIQPAELHEIRRIWRLERGDWADSVPEIFREVQGHDLEWVADDAATFGSDDAELLSSICEKEGIPEALVRSLVDVERSVHGLKRRHDVHRRLEELLSQEWRAESEVVAERKCQLEAEAP